MGAPTAPSSGARIADGAHRRAAARSTLVQYVPLVGGPGRRTRPTGGSTQAAGGGWLGASGSHVVDQVASGSASSPSVERALAVSSGRAGVAEDSFTVRFRLASGVEGVLQQTAAAWGPIAGIDRVSPGTDGTLWIEGDAAWLADADGVAPARRCRRSRASRAAAESDDPRHRFTHLELGPYTRLCEALRAGVEGRPVPDAVAVPTFADGLAEMQVLDADPHVRGRRHARQVAASACRTCDPA